MPWGSAPGWNNPGWSRAGAATVRIAGQTFTTSVAATMTVTGVTDIRSGDWLVAYTFGAAGAATQTLTLGSTGALTPVDTQNPADGNRYRTFAVQLASGDITGGSVDIAISGVTLTNTYVEVAVFRNVSAIVFKEWQSSDNSASTLNYTGFTPAANGRGAVVLGIDRQNTAPSPSTNPAFAGGGSWTKQTLTGGGELPGAALRMFQWDNLAYSGGAITSSGWPTTGTAGAGWNTGPLFELLAP